MSSIINIKLKNGIIFEATFANAFMRLFELEFDSDISLQLVKSSRVIEQQKRDIISARDIIAKRYAVVDEVGNVVLTGGLPSFSNEENKNKFYKEINDLSIEEFEIPLKNKIKLANGKITPAEIEILLAVGIISE